MNFIGLVYEASQSTEPIKVKMSRIIPTYSQFDREWLDRECSIVFENNAYTHLYEENVV